MLLRKAAFLSLLAWLGASGPALAQQEQSCGIEQTRAGPLDQTFDQLFSCFLIEGFSLSPGDHGGHFIPAAAEAANLLAPAMNSLIAGNIASFPLSSSLTGDLDENGNWIIGFGPIFAESAKTISMNKLTFGFNYSHLNLSSYRGLPTDHFRFTFTHEDRGVPGLGDLVAENDLVDLFLDLHVNANIYAFFATYGVTHRFDVGLAIPLVNVNLQGSARGVVRSYTFARRGVADHHFGLEADSLNPALEKVVRYDEGATGLGDLAVRLKYDFGQAGSLFRIAALFDLRMPTGDRKNFLGTGKPNTKFGLILSRKMQGGTAHFNIGYERRGAVLDSDELEVVFAIDHNVLPRLTLAAELIGNFDLEENEAIQLLPGAVQIVDRPEAGGGIVRRVALSNIPERRKDHTVDLALGLRLSASERFSLLGNVLAPLNNGGLRSTATATVGMSIFF